MQEALTCSVINSISNRKVDVRLPGKGNSSSHGARPVRLIITTIKWIWTSKLSIENCLSSVSKSIHFKDFPYTSLKAFRIRLDM